MLSPKTVIEFIATYLPALIANGSATLVSRGTPIDMGSRFVDGRRLLGDGKTWEGFTLALLYATSVVLLESQVINESLLAPSLLAALGALIGDMIGSFIKRRVGLERGQQAPLLDQLDFLLGAYAFSLLGGYTPPIPLAVGFAALVYGLHKLTNFIAYKLGIKNVPW